MKNLAFTLLENGLYMSLENVVLLIVVLAGFIIYAKDAKLGLMLHLFMSACLFMGYYAMGWNWVGPLVTMFIFLVLLTFTLYAVNKSTETQTGGMI